MSLNKDLDTIPSSSGLPGDVHIIRHAECCRVWPVGWAGPGTSIGRCGYCGTKPKLLPMSYGQEEA